MRNIPKKECEQLRDLADEVTTNKQQSHSDAMSAFFDHCAKTAKDCKKSCLKYIKKG